MGHGSPLARTTPSGGFIERLSPKRASCPLKQVHGPHLPAARSPRPRKEAYKINVMERSQGSTVAIATKLTLVLVVLLGGGWPVAAAPEVCVLAPHVAPAVASPPALPVALVPLSRPTLFLREPLAEIRLERGDTLLWRSPAPLEGPLAWPLAPLQPDALLTLRLRPLGADPSHFATIRLQSGSAERLTAGDALLRSLQVGPPAAWRPTIEGLLSRGDRSLATALLFASEGPNEPALNTLRLRAARDSCL